MKFQAFQLSECLHLNIEKMMLIWLLGLGVQILSTMKNHLEWNESNILNIETCSLKDFDESLSKLIMVYNSKTVIM